MITDPASEVKWPGKIKVAWLELGPTLFGHVVAQGSNGKSVFPENFNRIHSSMQLSRYLQRFSGLSG